MTAWTHNILASDLATHLRGTSDRLVWTDMQIGPSGSARPDVYTIPKSYSKFRPMAYEVKISVADFRGDVTAGKWQSYLDFASGVIFAVPRGLVGKSDVPAGCGLIVRTDDGWRNVKGPTLKHISTLPHEAWMKLMIDGLARQRHDLMIKQSPEWAAQRAAEKRYGAKVGRLFSDCNSVEFRLKERLQELTKELQSVDAEITDLQRTRWARERQQLEAERAKVEDLWVDLCRSIGLKPEERWKAKNFIADLHAERATEEAMRQATNALLSAHLAIRKAIEESPAALEQRVREYMTEIGERLDHEVAA